MNLDAGSRVKGRKDTISYDLKGGDVICDLNRDWPNKDEAFDKVILNHVLEHLGHPGHAIDEALRSIKKDGVVRIAVPSERCARYKWIDQEESMSHKWLFKCYGLRGRFRNYPMFFQKILGMFIPNEYIIEVRRNEA